MKPSPNGRAPQRILFLAPHPDDETLAAGGYLHRAVRRGDLLRVLFATDGDNSKWMQRLLERRWRLDAAARARYGLRRRREALAALEKLGVAADQVRYLQWADLGTTDLLMSDPASAIDLLIDAIEEFRPSRMLIPSMSDSHPDHSALALLAALALERLDPAMQPNEVWNFRIHGSAWDPSERVAAYIELDDSECEARNAAMRCHATQLIGRKHWLLAQLKPAETYFVESAASESPGGPFCAPIGHPIVSAVRGPRWTWLQVVLRDRPLSFGPARLQVLTEDHCGACRTRTVTLDWPARRGAGGDETSRGDAPGGAMLARRRLHGEVRLPSAWFAGASRTYVKIERLRGGIYDPAGWIDLTRAPLRSASPRVCAIIPCYNVASLCEGPVRKTAALADRLILIDDGSTDGTGAILEQLARESPDRISLIRFERNLGKGHALIAGLRRALEAPFDVVLTLDGDGQHRPEEIPKLVAAWSDGADLTIGERRDLDAMPARSRLGNSLTAFLFGRLDPGFPRDTQSGFRAMDRAFAEAILQDVPGSRYEMELSVLLLAMQKRARIAAAPISTIYFDGNRSSHFRPLADSLRIYGTLLRWVLSERSLVSAAAAASRAE